MLADRWTQGTFLLVDPEPVGWQACGRFSDLEEGKGVAVQIAGHPIALFLYDGNVEAIDARCPHAAGPLDRGWLDGGRVVCPLHRWKFEIRTGQCLTAPDKPVRHYRTRVDETGTIWVESGDLAK
ncbi:Rieske 2Fe-2S domain-containing protein [bacterium]|nr:Rieske 2Fe-2S domain-containing protein [bacterium]